MATVNGEVNGTVEEPMDTSSPVAKKATMCTAEVANHYNNTENSKTELAKEVSNNSVNADGHSSDSSESCSESADSSQHGPVPADGRMSVSSRDSSQHGPEPTDSKTSVSSRDNTRVECINDEVESADDSSDEEGSGGSDGPRAEDTVSIDSDSENDGGDETSQESKAKHKPNDIVVIDKIDENRPESRNGDEPGSPEVHEITSDTDECVVTNEEKPNTSVKECESISLRRSSRSVKRKRYDDMESADEESDIEEVAMEDPLRQFPGKKKAIVINDAKALMAMASKHVKTNHGHSENKKDSTVVIIDTNSILAGKGSTHQGHKAATTAGSTINTHNLYQSIAARGTTVTLVSNKTTPTQTPTPIPAPAPAPAPVTQQPAQAPILPSLTDDMFVVEAPSFIVPYVYEKPSVKPFREFVDVLGRELEEQKTKEEEEKAEKEKEEKERKEKELQEKRERGELKEETVAVEAEKESESTAREGVREESKKEDKSSSKSKERRRARPNEDDDDSWDGESSSSSEDEALSDEEKTVVIKEKDDTIEGMKDAIAELTSDKIIGGKPDGYFDCSLGKFFIDIGLGLVQEFVQKDLLKYEKRKLYKEKKTGAPTAATELGITSLTRTLECSKENNAPYSFHMKKCKFCSFKTESGLSMGHHMEAPHMKNNVYRCNFCPFEIRSPHDILYHMESEHNVRGRLERAPAYHQCANCPFEDNGKGKLARHQVSCANRFKPDLNLAPPLEWEPPAKIPKIVRSRNNMLGSQLGRPQGRVGTNNFSMNMVSMGGGVVEKRGRDRFSNLGMPRTSPTAPCSPLVRAGLILHHNTSSSSTMNYPIPQNNQYAKNAVNLSKQSQHQPSISITPLPRSQQPPPPQPTQHTKGTFVICEICDGYIKDLEQLRNHMQWIHDVKIHPKMIHNRPPLNCQKCQFRFFTDQGLERHLLGSHGLVTSSMQAAANKGKDAGRCPVCGRVFQWKLLNHVARDHNLTLKPAHLSYKCTVCTATFGMYKQFENHVYSAHSVVAKRVDKNKVTTATKQSFKPMKINDDVTIIPQPAKTTAAKDK